VLVGLLSNSPGPPKPPAIPLPPIGPELSIAGDNHEMATLSGTTPPSGAAVPVPVFPVMLVLTPPDTPKLPKASAASAFAPIGPDDPGPE
jgi:hypothetical protein